MQKSVFWILSLVVSFLVGALMGYMTSQRSSVLLLEKERSQSTMLPRADSITAWRSDFSGKITAMQDNLFTFQVGTKTISAQIFPSAKASKTIFGKPLTGTIQRQENFTVADMKVGDDALVSVVADQQGNLQIEQITILQSVPQ